MILNGLIGLILGWAAFPAILLALFLQAILFQIVEETAMLLGIEKLKNRFSYTLLYGEKRLVAIASILAMNPEIFLFDEPTVDFDEDTTKRINDFLRSHNYLTYCIVSHELSFLKDVVEKVYILEKSSLRVALPWFISFVKNSLFCQFTAEILTGLLWIAQCCKIQL